MLVYSCTFRGEAPFGKQTCFPKYPMSCILKIYMVRMVYLQNPKISCVMFPAPSRAPSGGKHPLKMKYPYSRRLCHVVSLCMARMVYFQNPWSGCLFLSCTFRREASFGKETCFPKYTMSCSFRIYMVRMVYLQNPWSGCLFLSCIFGREAPFGNDICLPKYPMSCSFRMYG